MGWRFPEKGRPAAEVLAEVEALVRRMRAQAAGPVVGKPDTPPHRLALEAWSRVSALNPNNGGVQTRSLPSPAAGRRRSPWEGARRRERSLVAMLAGLYGLPADAVDGYVTSGGTEGNLAGLWVGRNLLLGDPTGQEAEAGGSGPPVAVLAPRTVHHSVRKACNLLGLGEGRWSRCDRCGRPHHFAPAADGRGLHLLDVEAGHFALDLDACERQLRGLAERGVRRALVVATLGTTVTGTVDPVRALGERLREVKRRFGMTIHLHLDAALGGLVLPFLPAAAGTAGAADWGQWPEVDSLSLDWHKMGWAPYGAGTFLCRKDLPAWVERRVGYTTTGIDDTVLGSRSGAAAVACWAVVQALGAEGFRAVIAHCLALARRLHDGLRALPGLGVLPPAPINLVTFRLPAVGKGARDLLARLHLIPEWLSPAASRCPEELYPVFLMPHLTAADVDRFVAALADALP
jgi:glutamate/tyrosine decarboxylase-like PLP-dependent enzyme